MREDSKKLQQIVDGGGSIVFFGGAGVSTESGIPDFRSTDGLYAQQGGVPPEVILSRTYYREQPEAFYKFYKEKIIFTGVEPNAAHRKLAEMERAGRLLAVVTQNIDGLHQKAGSKNVLELHGSIRRNTCELCKKQYDEMFIKHSAGIPRCTCGGTVRPDVVLYGDPLDRDVFARAGQAISRAEVLIVAGTSLTVYPAAGLVEEFRGRHLVLINRAPTQNDGCATLLLRASVGEILSEIKIGEAAQ